MSVTSVIPAKAGTQSFLKQRAKPSKTEPVWIRACAGMKTYD
jgi:hypothetical protein